MKPYNQHEIDRYWATEMGAELEIPEMAPGVHCTVQRIYPGVQLFRRDGLLIIASPPHVADLVAARAGHLSIDELFSAETLKRMLAPDVTAVMGPAPVAYADCSNFRAVPVVSCRLLTDEDDALRAELAAALSEEDRENSGVEFKTGPMWGAFAEGMLCATASYQIWGERIAHITVATHPSRRRRGFGQMAISALAVEAFERDLILQYRALASNENSLRLGRSLSCQHYCTTIYAGLPAEVLPHQ